MTGPTAPPPNPPPARHLTGSSRDEILDRVIAAVRRIVEDPELRAAIEARLVGLHTPQTPAGTVPADREEGQQQ